MRPGTAAVVIFLVLAGLALTGVIQVNSDVLIVNPVLEGWR